MMVKYQNCYATHRNDDGNLATPFKFRRKTNAKHQTQRPTKVPNHYSKKP